MYTVHQIDSNLSGQMPLKHQTTNLLDLDLYLQRKNKRQKERKTEVIPPLCSYYSYLPYMTYIRGFKVCVYVCVTVSIDPLSS